MFIGYRNLQPVTLSECAFADDVVIVADTEKNLQHNLITWNNVLKKKGMTLNYSKTKVMMVAKVKEDIHIKIEGIELEQVDAFQYLGITIDSKGSEDIEINNRIRKANNVYYAINRD